MANLEKYKGVIPAFYACYDKEGNVSPEGSGLDTLPHQKRR